MSNDTQITANFIVARIREPLQSRPYKNRPIRAVNHMKTAKVFGLAIPDKLLASADKVIE
jgi:hypothetical protein